MKIKTIIYAGLMISLVFISTFGIRIPIPFTQGYIHLGDSMIFISAILFGWKIGGLAGGFGSALADLLGGYAIWAFPTLLIKFVMGAIVGFITNDAVKKNRKTARFIITSIAIFVWIIFAISIISVLGNISANIHTSDSASFLINELDIENTNQLRNMIRNVQITTSISIFIILISAFLASKYLKKKDPNLFNISNILGMTIAGLWMIVGYFITEGIIYGSFIVPIFGIPWNILQFVLGMIISFLVILGLKKIKFMNKISNEK